MPPVNAAIKLLKKSNTKEIEFNGGMLEVKELTYKEVEKLSKITSENDSTDALQNNWASLSLIIRTGVVGLDDISDADLQGVSIISLRKIAEAVLEFNGLKVSDVPGNV
jgi:hypothetical protein